MAITDSCQRRLKALVSVKGALRRALQRCPNSGLDTVAALALFRGLELSTQADLLQWRACSHPDVLPMKLTTVKALHACQATSLHLGFSPLCVAGVSPLTMEARVSQNGTLVGALQWAAERVATGAQDPDEVPPGQTLSAVYLYRLRQFALVSPWACALTMGVNVELAKLLCTPDFDRLTLEVFLRHFALKLRFRGSTEVKDDGCSRVQESFCDYLLTKDGNRKSCTLRLLRAMFSYRPEVDRSPQPISAEELNSVIGRLCETFIELRLTETTMLRFLTLILDDRSSAQKLARSLRWQICSMDTEKKRKHAPTPHGEVKEVLLQMVRSMILDALGSKYTAEDVVEVFIVVSLICLRTLAIDLVSGRTGFWIPWFEQQLYPFLESLTKVSLNEGKLCGERKGLSAKSNLKGES